MNKKMSSLKSERPEWNAYINEMIGAVAVYLSENDRKPLTNNEIIALTNFCCYISFNKWCFERGCGSEFHPKMKMIDLERINYSTWNRIEKKTSIIGMRLFTVYPLVNGLFSVRLSESGNDLLHLITEKHYRLISNQVLLRHGVCKSEVEENKVA